MHVFYRFLVRKTLERSSFPSAVHLSFGTVVTNGNNHKQFDQGFGRVYQPRCKTITLYYCQILSIFLTLFTIRLQNDFHLLMQADQYLKNLLQSHLFIYLFIYFIYLRYLNRRVQFSMAGLNGGLLKTVLYK